VTDLNRLGKRGSYRLGRLGARGAAPPGPPSPLRPRFRRRHQGPTALWLLAAVAGAALIAAGAAAGLWFVPFAAGLAAGLANRVGGWRARVLVPAVAAMAIAGWGIALWWPALHGRPAGGTAPVIAALARTAPAATAGVLVALGVGVLQALAGLWLGCSLTLYSRAAIPGAEMAEAGATGAADAGAADVRPLDARAADARAAGEPDRGSGGQPGPAGPTMGG
jgi:hypothetical protein